jgi:DNA polymerase III epsilon subunit-like protein
MKIMAFDTETTGLPDWKQPSESPQQPHIVEIAAVLYDDGQHAASFHAIVRPDGWTIPDDVAAIHGITTERAMDEGIPEHQAIAGFMAMHARGDIRVAHNESFDARILRIAIKRFGHGMHGWDCLTQEERDAIADAFKAAPSYCTCTNAKPIMQLPPTEKMAANPRFRNSYKPPNLQEAHKHFFGAEFEGAHGAMADAKACARIYYAMNPAKVPA